MHQIQFPLGLRPRAGVWGGAYSCNSAVLTYSAPPGPIAVFKGAYF